MAYKIPRTQLTEARVFPERNNIRIDEALRQALIAKSQPVSMPDILEGRIQGTIPFNEWFTTPTSIRATGRYKGEGDAEVIYAHNVETYLSNPDNIKIKIDKRDKELINGAARLGSTKEEAQKAFDRLRDRVDEKNVHVVPHSRFVKALSGFITVESALEHPQTIPFAGSEDTAKRYLPRHREAYKTDKIGMWHFDDLNDKEGPLGRWLCLGTDSYGFNGDVHFDGDGRVLAVSAGGANIPKSVVIDGVNYVPLEKPR
jgi:hypothetical protein